ncbi:MAG: MaoC family dehydratase [Alphaproteobacteria bacterium]
MTARLSELVPLGKTFTMKRQITRAVVDAYGDLVGDHDPIHFDEAFCQKTVYGRPIAHGTLLVGYMSAVSSMATQDTGIPFVSLGYDRMRFVGPAFVGEEVEAKLTIVGHEEERGRILADVTVSAGGRLLAIARNIIKLSA